MIRIALDAMGGDNAPRVEIEGVALALRDLPPGVVIQLVGRTADITAELAKHSDLDRARVEIIDAPEVVGMGEKPLAAIKGKPRSSIMVGLGLQKKGLSDAFISAGNTGAVMAASTLTLRLHKGVQRAAIGTVMPTGGQAVLLIDAGANVDCDARELVGFAHLGAVYARDMLGRATPNVGLLNIGEEDEKGNAVVKEAHQLLQQATGFHYIGNIEGRDIPVGAARGQQIDVVVCDGFTGNVVLKFYESAAQVFVAFINRDAPDVLKRPEMGNVLKVLDYATYGGAPLLGVQGVSLICHGSSPARAIKQAIRGAALAVQNHLSQDIGAEMAQGESGGVTGA
ncbi:MAG TPA: phosphate acyltransferase PlsX [Gemmatimonadales bacterium]|nr:phosphate acyltransferase PlsX [Gemmatimonadales bacterium]